MTELGLYHPVEDAFDLVLNKAERLENRKTLKFVRTVAGMRRYRQPAGSIIVRDGEQPLNGLTAVANDVPGYEKVQDKDGNSYYVGLEGDKWVVRNPVDNSKMYETAQEDEAFSWLNDKVGGARTEPTENDPFRASPNNKPTDPRDRKIERERLSAEKYGLTVGQATAVDNLSTYRMEQYRFARDRGMNHREAYREALRAKEPRGRDKR